MQIIPVIDLMGGIVVHAMRGNRAHYAPIQSRLSESAELLDILDGFLKLYAFRTIYIADIDAIQHRDSHFAQLLNAKQRFPHLTFWLDAGLPSSDQFRACQQAGILPIIGTESITDAVQMETLQAIPSSDYVLSLDFYQGMLRGLPALANPAHWPDKLICMQLDRVGNQSGPDVSCIPRALRKRHAVFAAGGTRHYEDIQSLASENIAGVLMATALHDQTIHASHLLQLEAISAQATLSDTQSNCSEQ